MHKDSGSTEAAKLDAKVKGLRYEKEELEFDQVRGKLIDKEKHINVMKEKVAELRVEIMSIPERTPHMLAGKKIDEMCLILRNECGQALRNFANSLVKQRRSSEHFSKNAVIYHLHAR